MAAADLVTTISGLAPLADGERVLAALPVQRKQQVDGKQMAAGLAGGAVGAALYQAARKDTTDQRAAYQKAEKELGVAFTAMVWAVTPARLLVCKASSLTGKPSAFVAAHKLSIVEFVEVGDRLTRTPVTVKIHGLPITVTASKKDDVTGFVEALTQAIEWRRSSPL